MSTEIDRRVVEMQFNNKDFERNVQQSLGTIEKLKMALDFDGAKGLDSITKAANKVDMSNIVDQTSKVQLSFSALQVAGATMVSELTRSFINFGKNLWNMSFGQMKSGGMARALKIEQANFKMAALAKNIKGIGDDAERTKALLDAMGESIDNAVTGTAYGYDSAANVASQLMASGLTDAEKMYTYLRGIAGAAAMTGRTFDDIGNIFSTVSSNGKLMTMQLRQFSAAGLNVSATLAQQLGKTEEQINDMVTKGKIGFEEFAQAMYDAFGESAGKADDTYAGVLSNVKAQLSRLGQRFAVPYIENMIPFLQQLKATIKEISATLDPIAKRWDKLFGKITKWGAGVLKSINYQKFTVIFRGIENLVWGVVIVLHTLKEAFMEVFPPKTTNEIMEAAYAFERFTEQILPTKEAVSGLRGLFAALLTPFKIVLKTFSTMSKYMQPVIVAVLRIVYAFVSVFEILEPLALGLIDFIDRMGILEGVINVITTAMVYCAVVLRVLIELFVEFVKKVAYSERLQRVADTLKDIGYTVATYLVKALTFVLEVIDGLIDRINNASSGTTFFDQLINNATLLWDVIVSLGESFAYWLNTADSSQGINAIVTFFQELGNLIGNFFTGKDISQNINGMADALGKLRERIKEMWDQFKVAWDSIDKGEVIMLLFAVTILACSMALKHLIDNLSTFVIKMADIPEILKDLRDAIKNVGNFAGPAQTILAFSVAVAVVTNALVTLSNIKDREALKQSAILLGALGGGILIFALAMEIFAKKIDKGTEQVIDRSALSLLAITGSIVALVVSLKILSGLKSSTEDMIKYVGIISALMITLIVGMKLLTKLVPEIKSGSVAFLSFAAGVFILVKAINLLDNLEIQHLTETLSGLATVLIGFGFAVGLAGRASGWASLAIMAFTTSVIVMMGLFMLLAFIPYDTIMAAVDRAKAIFEAFIPLIMSIGIASRIAGKTENGNKNAFGGNLWAIILALTAFLGMFVVFAKLINASEAWSALGVMTVYLSLMGSFLAILVFIESKISETARNSREALRNANQAQATFAGLAKVLLAMGAAMVGIGIAAKLMENLNGKAAATLIWTFSAMMATLLGLETLIDKSAGVSKASLWNLLMLISGIGLIIAALVALQWADETKLVIGATAMAVSMLSLAMLVAAISSIDERAIRASKKNMPMIAVVIIALGGLVAAIASTFLILRKSFEGLGPEDSKGIIATFAAIVVAIELMFITTLALIKFIRKYLKDDTNSLLIISGSMLMMAAVFDVIGASFLIMRKAFSGTNLGSIVAMLTHSIALFGAVTAVMIALGILASGLESPWDLMKISASMVVLGAVFAEIGAAFIIMKQAFDQISVDTMDKMFADLSLLFLGMTAAMILLGALSTRVDAVDFVLIGAAMNLLALSLIEIAGAFAIMKHSGASPDEITAYALAFGIFLAATAAISAVLGYFTPAAIGLIALGTAFLFIGSSVKNIGEGILNVAKAVRYLGNVSSEEMEQFIENAKTFFGRFDEIAASFKKAFPAIQGVVRECLLGIAQLVGEFVGLTTAVAIAAFIQAIYENLDVILKGIALILGVIVDWLSQDEVQNLIYNAFKVLADSAISALDGLLESLTGIPDMIKNIIDAANGGSVETGVDIINGTRQAFMEWTKTGTDNEQFQSWETAYAAVMKELGEYSKIPFEEMTTAQHDAYIELLGWGDDLMQYAAEKGWFIDSLTSRLNPLNKDVNRNESYLKMFGNMYEYLDGNEEAFNRFLTGLYKYGDEVERIGSISFELGGRNLQRGLITDEEKYMRENLFAKNYYDYILEKYENMSETVQQEMQNMGTIFEQETDNVDILGQAFNKTGDSITVVSLNLGKNTQALAVYNQTASKAEAITAGAASEIENLGEGFNKAADESSDFEDKWTYHLTGANQAYAGFGYNIKRHPVRPRIDAAGLHLFNSEVQITNGKLKGLTQNSATTAIYGLATMKGLSKASTIVKGDVKLVGDQIDDTADATEDTSDAVVNLNNAVDEMSSKIPGVKDFFSAFLNGARQASPAVDSFFNSVDQFMGKTGANQSVWTAEQWREYGMEDVRKDLPNGMWYYAHRYEVEDGGYKDIEAYVNAKSRYGKDTAYDILGWLDKAVDEASEKVKDLLPDLGDMTDGITDVGDAADYATDYTDKLKESIESTLDVFTAFNKEVKLTGREILANFYSQIDGVQTWQKELEELATRGMNKNFLNQLAEEGPKAYDRIHAFYTMTEAEMTLFNTIYAKKLMIQRSSQNQIRKTFVATGNMMQSELDKFETSIGEQYDEKLARAQAKAAKSKAGTIAESTQKSLDNMYETIEEYESDTAFIDQWKDYIGSSTVKLDLMNAFSQLGYSSIDAFAQSMNFQKVMEKILQFKNTVKEQVKSSLNLFDEVKEVEEKDKMTTTEILNNMEENLKRVGGWSYNLKKMISMGFSEGLIEELRQMGPEAADKVEAFVKMTANEVSMANQYWGESVQLPESISERLTDEYAKAGFEISLGLKKGLDEGSEDFYDRFKVAGEDASQGYVDGIDSEAANDAMDQLGQNTLDRLMKKLDEHSPSREMMKIGSNAVAGYLIGLKSGIKGLNPFIRDLSSKVLNGFADGISIDDNIGNNINDILNTMTDELYSVGNAANMIDLDNVYEPVIRPVWDTTAIETGFTTIDQFLSGKTISLKAVDAAAQHSGPSQDAVMITNAINNLYNEQKIIRNDINGIRSDVSSLGNRIDGMRVVLDGNALVGELVAPLDKAMGNKVVKQKRGRV